MMPTRTLLRCAALLAGAITAVPCAAQLPRRTVAPVDRTAEYATIQRTAAPIYARLASGPPQTASQVNDQLAPLRAALDLWSRKYGVALTRVNRPADRNGGAGSSDVKTRIKVRLTKYPGDNDLLYCPETVEVSGQECRLDGAEASDKDELVCSYRCDPPKNSK
jgi:hypothetical protein